MSDLTMQSANTLQFGRQYGLQNGSQPWSTFGNPPGSQDLASRLTALREAQSPASNAATAASPRLVKAAHEFEASMMKELLAPMQPGKDPLSSEDESDPSNAALSEFASEALGKAISERGGLGIAKSILHQLAASTRFSSTVPTMDEMPQEIRAVASATRRMPEVLKIDRQTAMRIAR
jgi:Rod binding domain-containing protein